MNVISRKTAAAKFRTACLALALLTMSSLARAERLPIKTYTTVDGLAHNNVNKIVRDSRGFLWFCTGDGLSRFDGYTFTNYGTDQGLPHREVTDFLETRGGEYWVATYAGLVRFNPKAPPEPRVVYANGHDLGAGPMFTVITPDVEDRYARAITVLFEDHSGAIWCGSNRGLYRLDRAQGRLALRPIDIGIPQDWDEGQIIDDLLEDKRGSLWVAAPGGLYRRWPDGNSARYTKRDGLPDEYLHDLFEDHDGRLWAGTRYGGFFQFAADDTRRPPIVVQAFSTREGMPTPWVFQLFETSDYKFWVATAQGLLQFFLNRDEQGQWFHSYGERNGLSFCNITALDEDLGGNLWLGTNTAGAMKLERSGFITYGQRDGLYSITSIFGDRAGGLCFRGSVIGDKRSSVFEGARLDPLGRTPDYHHTRLGRFDGRTFTWFTPHAISDLGWVGEGVTLQTPNGEWWIGGAHGLYRFPAVDNFDQIKRARPLAVYTGKDGLGAGYPFRLFGDSHGNVWASAFPQHLLLWERDSKALRDMSKTPGLPSEDGLPRSFGEDHAGNVWIGFNGQIARYRDGVFTLFTASDGLPPGAITSIYVDSAGRLWLASARSGLIRVDDPGERRPNFVSYTTAQGLSSNSTEVSERLIVEDLQGRIYIGTGRGLDRLDPATGHFKHFTTADGLAPGSFRACFRDPYGVFWFGTTGGLSRFAPAPDKSAEAPPSILISGLRVAGSRQFISALDETEILLPDLAVDQNQLQIDFTGLSFAPGELLRYQYKVEGASEDWSPPTEQRSVNYSLAPGRYRFLVRAVNSDGAVSSNPANVTFRILPPLWERWWFLALSAIGLTLTLYRLYRYRVARLMELERVRTRIASDLHDDIGANLSLIAGLSDVLRQQTPSSDPQVSERLSLIASVSRRSVDAMSDIVWAINPNRDHLGDLTQRMRRFAMETLGSRGIEFRFDSPGLDHSAKVSADVRREVFLIFKEGVNNIARHSHCASADITIETEGGMVLLKMSDNGVGFETPNADWGQGLYSMRKRAEKVGAELNLISSPGQGATLIVKAPLK
jgi:signal transduction histidine kinase/ligand-binding sensor domain-containing protein